MTSDLTKPADEMRDLVASVHDYAKANLAPKTVIDREAEFRHFRMWCESKGLPSLPSTPEVVCMYLAARVEGKVRIEWRGRGGELRSSTKRITVVHAEVLYRAIIWVHRENGHEWPYAEPRVMRVMKGMRRTHGKPPRRVAALEIGTLKAGLVGYKAPWPPERRLRDVTLLSLGFFGALRRGELLALCVEDIEFVPEGMVITIRKSKTDQERQGAQLGIPSQKDPAICPVALTRQWLAWMKDEAYITAGHLFRRLDTNGCMGDKPLTTNVVADLVRSFVEQAGLDPKVFAGHSLRAGFITSAAKKGASLPKIMRQSRHKSERMAMTYIRPATLFDDNAADGMGDDDEEKKR